MAKFLIRIELHYADRSDYKPLHDAMHKAGFTNTIISDSGAKWELPSAEYIFIGTADRNDVFNSAKACANATGKKSWVLVVEYTAAIWDLKEL